MSGDAGWIYWDDGERGPVSLEQLVEMVRHGRIAAATDLRRPAEAGWKPAGAHLPELFLADAPPAGADDGWTDLRPHPWRRYAARMMDATVVGGVVATAVGMLLYGFAPERLQPMLGLIDSPAGRLLDIMLTHLVVIPFNAVSIGLSGLTLGKWVFGVRVCRDGRPPGVKLAFRRELSVWFRGLGCAIPLATLFMVIDSSNKLKDEGRTHWDRALKLTVRHRPESRAATVWMWVAALALFVSRALF